VRQALYAWAFNAPRRAAGPPEDLEATIRWLERNTAALQDLSKQPLQTAGNRTSERAIDGTTRGPLLPRSP